jgi:hypothetical protein
MKQKENQVKEKYEPKNKKNKPIWTKR